ncbi:glycosyltransferase involved in cell wall biosynthesis [Edaphobacter aggregans]|uniref:Glycosyltransferase involved in cell wall biosynthesis n=1 Tax=Edaphobacter aggregans TaxID=570835 RepID=A0A3R9QIV0_9BACT|nr:glycosyltransferase family 4 protein [Edaphobacter aggregans]RSL17559.1 glycosyltransferase involved in cell wall biosynthesis [Edaphobacter aggregans]
MMDMLATVPYYTAYLAKALLLEHVDVTVGSISYYLDPSCFSSRGIEIDPGLLDVVGKFHLSRLPRRILKLIEAILNLSALSIRFLVAAPPDVIHVQYLPMLMWRVPLDLWFVEFCRKRGSKTVLTVHDLLPHDTGEAYKQTFHDLYRMVDRIICHSDHIRARLGAEFSVPEEKIAVIPHGPFFYDLPAVGSEQTLQNFQIGPDKVTILWQGIIFPYKGIDLLLDAWQKVEENTQDACLVVAGTGAPELLEQIREQVKQLDLKRVKLHFRFISTEDLVALYRVADVVVYPYRAITTSGALATGLALGKAIVASDLPVFRELLTDRENALLVDPQDSLKLAGALIELTQDAALRERLAGKVRQMNFGDHSWHSIARKTMQAYESVLLYPLS